MSLRSFHVVFIVTAALFCFSFGGWGVVRYQAGYAPGVWYAVLAFVAGAGLIPYLTWYIRHSRSAV